MSECKHPGMPGSFYHYYSKKCRCDECVIAHAANLVKKAARRLERFGPPKPTSRTKPLAEHGDRRRYAKGCRCELCSEANRLAHYYYADGTVKPGRTPHPTRVGSGRRTDRAKAVAAGRKPPPEPKAARAAPLRIVGLSEKVRPIKVPPRTYVPEAVDICGLETDAGGYCRKRLPCPRPEHQEF